MARREAILTAVVMMAAAAMALTVSPETQTSPVAVGLGPKGEDWRYPKYIVDPRIKCVSEGTFPHPRNCSWYYRCVDRMKVGFYFTYYFECEPGTVFDDFLDQCVFPHLASAPCGNITLSTPAPVTKPPTVSTVSTTSTSTTTTTTTTVAPTGTTPSVTVPLTCKFHERHCKRLEYCLPTKVVRNLCTGCDIGIITLSAEQFCGKANTVYDKDANKCVEKPPDSNLCPAIITPFTTSSTTPSTTTTTTTTTTTPAGVGVPITGSNTFTCSYSKPIPDEPWIRRTFCEKFILCDANKKFKAFKELCTSYYECSRTPQQTWTYSEKSCPGVDFFYSFEANACVKLNRAELC
ncbi:uncharacterized protein LOC126998050 [Eriocheir sinensis]|uniref:uncharacterized protein LOC126998050 n=1 Tax=Eriocheir sinensis TaxID=95602 RepID=UPI0021C94279|nr:uncharacterized protein LOC126998050 [Eriocheir sinensis]